MTGPSGSTIVGTADVGDADASWSFVPREPWSGAEYGIRIDPVLEDTAGNSIHRLFDRELEAVSGHDVAPVTTLTFTPLP